MGESTLGPCFLVPGHGRLIAKMQDFEHRGSEVHEQPRSKPAVEKAS